MDIDIYLAQGKDFDKVKEWLQGAPMRTVNMNPQHRKEDILPRIKNYTYSPFFVEQRSENHRVILGLYVVEVIDKEIHEICKSWSNDPNLQISSSMDDDIINKIRKNLGLPQK